MFPRAHLDQVRDRSACIQYCSKGRVLKMKVRAAAQRSLSDAITALLDGGMRRVAHEYPEVLVKHHRGLERLMQVLQDDEEKRKPLVSWYWGPTGSGKTRKATEDVDCDQLLILTKSAGPLWFDGYTNQKRVVFDDFRKDWCTFHYLLNLLDRYKIRVPVKGGFVNWNPEEIIITCPQDPRSLYSDEFGKEREDI